MRQNQFRYIKTLSLSFHSKEERYKNAFAKCTWISYSGLKYFYKVPIGEPIKIGIPQLGYSGGTCPTVDYCSRRFWTSSPAQSIAFSLIDEGSWDSGWNRGAFFQRPALYLIKRITNRFYQFILTSVIMQYVIQRKGIFYAFEQSTWISYSNVSIFHQRIVNVSLSTSDPVFTSWSGITLMSSYYDSLLVHNFGNKGQLGPVHTWPDSIQRQRPAFY